MLPLCGCQASVHRSDLKDLRGSFEDTISTFAQNGENALRDRLRVMYLERRGLKPTMTIHGLWRGELLFNLFHLFKTSEPIS